MRKRSLLKVGALGAVIAGALELERRPVALQEVAAEVVDAMQAQAKQAGVALALRVDGSPSELSLDGARIERVAANLVRNALEHAPVGSQVAVRVFAENGWAALEVTDNGEGMEPDVIERVWDRFYRGERSRQRRPGRDVHRPAAGGLAFNFRLRRAGPPEAGRRGGILILRSQQLLRLCQRGV